VTRAPLPRPRRSPARRPVARPALATLVALSALAVAWPSGAFGSSSSSEQAQQLVERTHQAAASHDFSGVATVTWTDNGRTRRVQVDVTDSSGTVEARAGGSVVYDSGARTYLKDGNRWTSVVVDPTGGDLPDPASHWRLSARAGAEVAGRPTTEVVASRRDGTVAQRIFVDDATGLLLRRDVLDRGGAIERSLVFTDVEVGPATTEVTAPAGLRAERSSTIATVPDGYRAPSALGGSALVTRAKHPDGVLLYYSDGLFSTSVFEQRGSLDWSALPDGGTTTEVRGTTARRYSEPSATVLVWERDGVVYTCVSDAPADVFTASVGDLTGPGRNAIERAADFVLGPFGWS
jgi:sigma-E factor negative regulatory protein RseB